MLLNSQWTNGFFDVLMPFITNVRTWFPLIILLVIYALYKGNREVRTVVIIAVIATCCADFFSAKGIKNNFPRQRPCVREQTDDFSYRLMIRRRTTASFPSNHAANTAAFAFSILFTVGFKYAGVFLVISFFIGYSRVYCGVHFPFDVLVGWFIGMSFAYIAARIARAFKLYPVQVPQISSDQTQDEHVSEET